MIYTGYADFWFQDTPLPDRISRFSSMGIKPIDIWMWRSKGVQLMSETAAACRESRCFINSTFDEAAGSFTDSNDHAYCLEAWAETIEHAVAWGVKHLFVFSEQVDPYSPPKGVSHDINGWTRRSSRNFSQAQKYANFLDGVGKLMAMIEKTDIVVWLEALNTYHLHGDITIHTHDLAADAIRRINHPQFRMTFDCYHQQRTAGNLIQGLVDYYGLYDSVHIGDVPTRCEPGTGEINFVNIAVKLKEIGYDADGKGLIGMEFSPSISEEHAFRRVKAIFGDRVS